MLNVIGNVQLDAALDSDVLKIKDPDSSFLPPANVFVFPNLDAGNIGYKLVQRFSGARALAQFFKGYQSQSMTYLEVAALMRY